MNTFKVFNFLCSHTVSSGPNKQEITGVRVDLYVCMLKTCFGDRVFSVADRFRLLEQPGRCDLLC